MANQGSTTYSFKDTVGALVSALAGSFTIAGGKVGVGKLIVSNATTRSEMETASDGAVVTSAIVGSSGGLQIDCQQTSSIHKYLLAAANAHFAAVESNDVSQFIGITAQLRNIVDGSQHLLTGMSFVKIPDKAYDTKAGMLTWNLNASNVVNL